MDFSKRTNSNQTNVFFKFNVSNKYVFENNGKKKDLLPNNLSIEIVSKFKEFKEFYKLPFQLYKDNLFWIPTFWHEFKNFFKQNNPFWSHSESVLFLLRKNNLPVGRIAAIIDHKFCENEGKKIGYFGFFECINDFKCAESLFNIVQNYLHSKGMTYMRGPIDGRVDVGCGFLLSGYDSSPGFLSSYSHQYYIKFAEKFNFKKLRDLYIYYIDLTKPISKKLKEKALDCSKSGIKIRNFNRFHTKKELNWWVKLFLETFEDHWGYVPVSGEEVRTRFGIKQMRWFVDTKLFLIAELDNKSVAYIWSTPDYNQIFKKMKGKLGPYQLLQFVIFNRKINIGKLPLIGIKKEYRNKNIGSYLNYLTLVEMKKRGYVSAEVGWIDENNQIANTTIAITGAKVYKKYRVFEKQIDMS